MQDLLSLHMQYTSGTECTPQNNRWAMLGCVAALLGRRVHLKFGHLTIYPNMYIFLVGPPASRKTTAMGIAENLLRQAEYDAFASSRSTREKFLLDFELGFSARTGDGKIDFIKLLDKPDMGKDDEVIQECFIYVDEFVDFIDIRNSKFLNMLTTLYDNKASYEERLKNSKSVFLRNPTINIVAGLTPTSLSMVLPPEMIGQGYTSRLILVHSGKVTKKITFPKAPDKKLGLEISSRLREIAKMQGEITYHPDAMVLLDKIYQSYTPLNDGRLQHYCSRRFIHLLKMCMIFACSRLTTVITPEIVEEANTILSYTEAHMHLALGEFGDAKHAKASQAVMEVLTQATEPLTMMDIWQSVSTDIERIAQLNDILNSLKFANKILVTTNSDGDNTVILNRELSRSNTQGVNYSKWIPEFEKLPEDF